MDRVRVIINPTAHLHQVSRYLYSHFIEHLGSCVYGGIWVGEDSKIENDAGIRTDVVTALKKIAPPALRWPGGCFADLYHWMDGIGPREKRPRTHNWCQPETNQFGTHEFMRFCSMIGAEPYLALNVGSGTVEEARKWVEYCNSTQDTTLTRMRKANGRAEPYNVTFWGIGNENWGCGGNMRPEYYADLYLQFATFIRHTAGANVKLVACGSHKLLPDWDARLLAAMKSADPTRSKYGLVDFLGTHVYSHGNSHGKRIPSVPEVTDKQYYSLIAEVDTMDRVIQRASDAGQAHGGVGVMMDEWSAWYADAVSEKGLQQSNGLMDALFAAAAFHCFHRHKHLFMTNLAQMVNVLQSVIYAQGRRMFTTPTYHVYEMFIPHRGNYLVPIEVKSPSLPTPRLNFFGELSGCPGTPRPAVSVSATGTADKKGLFVSFLNLHIKEDAEVSVELVGQRNVRLKKARQLSSRDIRDGNTFDAPDNIKPRTINLKISRMPFKVRLPSHSITTLELVSS
jgi:alpha-N-arabinofuranosidase